MNERISYLCSKCRFEGSRQCSHCEKGDLFMENRVCSNMPPTSMGQVSYARFYEMFHKNLDNPIKIKNVIFNEPATIVFWADGTKTVVKCQDGDVFDPEKGLAMAFMKKVMGNKGNYFNEIKKWVPEEYYEEPAEATCTVKFDGAKLAEELRKSMGNITLNFKAIKAKERPENPCIGCDHGWGSAIANGEAKSCHDECEVYKDYIKSLEEDK